MSMCLPPEPRSMIWLIDLQGSELASVQADGTDLIVIFSAAKVSGDRRQLDPLIGGGHLRGVHWRLHQARWTGDLSSLIGRIDEADWRIEAQAPAQARQPRQADQVCAPSQGSGPVHLRLHTAMGDTLVVDAQGWFVARPPDAAFSPSLAC